ncbi:TetR family transcriptional regulator [Phytoactinopolyspora mesophila]|uniref:TetR family transcriptional regulator n=1 Tax=Phytoactinopolyspora mesophila TaxID=2650750 RepID=UPI001391A47D
MEERLPMRARIVEGAWGCMREHGVRSATTKAVAHRAGVSEGSIYNHFANRSELIIEAFALATQGIRQRAAELEQLVGADTVEQNLVGLMEAIIEFFREVAPIVGSILGDPELRAWFTEGAVPSPDGGALTPLTGVVEVSAYLEREYQQGRLPNRGSWPVAAAMLIGACLHYVYLEQLSPSGIHGMLPGETTSAASYARDVVHTLLDQ